MITLDPNGKCPSTGLLFIVDGLTIKSFIINRGQTLICDMFDIILNTNHKGKKLLMDKGHANLNVSQVSEEDVMLELL